MNFMPIHKVTVRASNALYGDLSDQLSSHARSTQQRPSHGETTDDLTPHRLRNCHDIIYALHSPFLLIHPSLIDPSQP